MKKNIKKIGAVILIIAMLISAMGVLAACGNSSKGENGEVRVYSLGDYIDPDLVGAFEKATGIKVYVYVPGVRSREQILCSAYIWNFRHHVQYGKYR